MCQMGRGMNDWRRGLINLELLHLLNRPALSIAFGESAKHWVAKNCSWELFGSRLMHVYSQVLEDYYAGNMALF
jgi:hypothetical protein